MRVPDFILIPSLVSSELWRRFSRRVRSGPLYRWRFTGSVPNQLSIAPQDLRPADPTLANEFYMGHFNFAQETVLSGGESPFTLTAPNSEWFTELHSFRWLRHLRAADTDLIQANANAFVADWINQWGNQLDTQAWRSDITAARIISWLSHSPLLAKNTSPEAYRDFLKSIARQARYLHHNAPSVRDGFPRLHAMIALAYASLCLQNKEKIIKQAGQELDKELNRQILADGGHLSRNPIVLLELLADLLPLRQAYLKQGHSPSRTLISAIDRMMTALRFFRHSNGDLAQFNGTGFTPVALLTTILRYDDVKGSAQQSAPDSGYERLATKDTVVLIDTGKALSRGTARRAMAGTLSFELSSGNTRFISNCGIPDSSFSLYARFARSTAAHSTATIGNTSSSRFANDSKLHTYLPSPLIKGPDKVTSKRTSNGNYEIVVATHDGYNLEFGIIHQRELQLSKDGNNLNGCDQFQTETKSVQRATSIEIRFHLPPNISASLLSSGHSILIANQENDAWTFSCIDGKISLEESIQFSGPSQPRKSLQIVISVNLEHSTEIRWTFERRKKRSGTRNREKPPKQPQFPDLLDGLEKGNKG